MTTMTEPDVGLYAHEMVPHLPEWDEHGARWSTRQHVATAAGLLYGWYRHPWSDPQADPEKFRLAMERLQRALAAAELALLSYAVLTEQPTPHEWVRRRLEPDVVGEWLYEVGLLLGLDMDRLRPYPLQQPS